MKFLRFIAGAVAILAPIFLLILIVMNGVNVPFFDEWGIPGAFLALDKRTFGDFFHQANESRLIVPKLIFLTVSHFVGWQPKLYMYLGWLIAVAIFLAFWKQCYRRPGRGRRLDLTSVCCLAVSSAILFSPAAYENWLWGLSWVIFVQLLCALVAYHIQARTRSFSIRFGATVFLNGVAMFSFSSGILLWLVSFPFWREGLRLMSACPLSKARRATFLRWSLAYLLTAAIFLGTYFSGYREIKHHPSFAYVLHHPWDALKYLAAWCGGPFDSSAVISMTMGLAMVVSVLVLFVFIIIRYRRLRMWKSGFQLRRAYPSLLIIALALSSGIITTLGRAGFGLEQAFSPRYLFHSGSLLIGFIAVLNARRMVALGAPRRMGRLAVVHGILALSLIFTVRGWYHGCMGFEGWRTVQMQHLLTIRFANISPKSPLIQKTCPNPNVDLRRLLHVLREKQIYAEPAYGEWIIEALTQPRAETGGSVRIVRQPMPNIRLGGWAMIPGRNIPADAVLVCRAESSGNREPWMLIAVSIKRPDVVEVTRQPTLLKSGFDETFQWSGPDALPALELFSVDERNRCLYPLVEVQ